MVIKTALKRGDQGSRAYVVDADIQTFFDNVNQEKLMKLVEQRISDRRILKLIRQWLKAGVLYENVLEISELGTSQGSVISPLLANIYLNTLDRLWEKYGFTHGKLVRYADELIKIINPKIIGWRNYYKTKTATKWMHALDWYIICTFVRWYNKKHQRPRHLSQMKKVRTILSEKGLQKLSA
ncbi:reverse transcriptase domain-containing protein [Lachnotalea glycerini]|uniref:Reverse transcriptase domain-containing protein n=1 Tax=Lachnotalea glycerini TaxID=1763509 RepID=A0A371JEA2_9FIRM|nr:reverse transcriptase domain-containing protein [Lachnotalea glycerini]RDY31016.1 hypothetical protein CG710_011585 [Lachnotalea glycerini]